MISRVQQKQEVSPEKQSDFCIKTDDYNSELPETPIYFPEIVPLLSPLQSKYIPKNEDIFKNAEFWMYKGLGILSLKQNALDYFLSGVKIDPKHYGCAYNCAYSYFADRKYRNALKWFDLAL